MQQPPEERGHVADASSSAVPRLYASYLDAFVGPVTVTGHGENGAVCKRVVHGASEWRQPNHDPQDGSTWDLADRLLAGVVLTDAETISLAVLLWNIDRRIVPACRCAECLLARRLVSQFDNRLSSEWRDRWSYLRPGARIDGLDVPHARLVQP